ncbi:hypothetical protein FB471_4450 [Amycolatopsis cihanbeyliensis]|uniref:Uncharacterized protein n=2 Tax=Amycolatopsis cihanbeyliensis TaxID=1128664 RepID=A0A542DNL7_AMYCI|nr:hypothetical protein FB471_4450 [Amycolatopsis cihanbeyliensis]
MFRRKPAESLMRARVEVYPQVDIAAMAIVTTPLWPAEPTLDHAYETFEHHARHAAFLATSGTVEALTELVRAVRDLIGTMSRLRTESRPGYGNSVGAADQTPLDDALGVVHQARKRYVQAARTDLGLPDGWTPIDPPDTEV